MNSAVLHDKLSVTYPDGFHVMTSAEMTRILDEPRLVEDAPGAPELRVTEGAIVEDGTHAELSEAGGIYETL